MSTSYWRSSAEDEAMQDEHGFLWKAMLDTIDTELTGRRVLDAGCNRGASCACSSTPRASPKAMGTIQPRVP